MKQTRLRQFGAWILAAGIAVSLASCGTSPEIGREEAVNLTQALTPSSAGAPAKITETQAAQLTDFSLRLAWHSIPAGENSLLSPVSAATALGMTMNGAEGETLAEMEAVLGLNLSDLNDALRAYWRNLPNQGESSVQSANSLWLTDQQDFVPEPSFLQACIDSYDAEVWQAPMNDDTCQAINRWVSAQTEGMIPTILDELSSDAILYLINALAFEGMWEEPYAEHQVGEGDFLTADGRRVKTEFLRSLEGQYLENGQAIGVLKPYRGGDYAFVALLPKGDLTPLELLSTLDGQRLQALLQNSWAASVQTAIPKFETTCTLELQEILRDMGMGLAFDAQQADFSGLGRVSDQSLYISRVLHQTALSLGEQGTRASAASVVELKESAAADVSIEIALNRPFVYLLMDTTSCVPLFLGVMSDPTELPPTLAPSSP